MELIAGLVILMLQAGFGVRNWVLSTDGFLSYNINSTAANIS
jgi:hypothetical protein